MVCRRCGENKSAEEMQPEKRGGNRQTHKAHCRKCHSKSLAEWHQKHKERRLPILKAKNRQWKELKRRWLYEYLEQHPCVSCGADEPVVLEFNHIDRSTKEFDISYGVSHFSLENIMAEVAKCEVLCANCHRRVTARQFGWYSWLTAASAPAGSSPA